MVGTGIIFFRPFISTQINFTGPQEASVGQIEQFKKLFLFPGFLVYISVLISASLAIIFYFGPKYAIFFTRLLIVTYMIIIGMGRRACCGISLCAV
jgi:magnesium transporter